MSLISGGFCSSVYLTDPDAWFIITDAQQGLQYVERKALTKGLEGDFDSGNMRYKVRERYGFWFADPRGVYGSSGA
jgi:hypothetical protein